MRATILANVFAFWRDGTMRATLLWIGLLALRSVACISQAPHLGSITVTVLDDAGASVQSARVIAPHAGEMEDMFPMCGTGKDGTCTMHALGPGRFSISASKDEDGYAPQGPFYNGWHYKETILTMAEATLAEHATLHLGPKAGIIHAHVWDEVTGKAMVGDVHFEWASDPTLWLETGLSELGGPRLIPSNVPVRMTVRWKGYDDWTYAAGRGPDKTAILLKPGQVLSLDIRLHPKA
jgi:hypothetical protein